MAEFRLGMMQAMASVPLQGLYCQWQAPHCQFGTHHFTSCEFMWSTKSTLGTVDRLTLATGGSGHANVHVLMLLTIRFVFTYALAIVHITA